MKFTADNFDKEVLQSQIPVLVDFYADWCGPCRMMAPLVEKLAGKYEGQIKVGKVNVDEEMALAQKNRVASIPTFMVFAGGEAKGTYVGAMSASELEEKLKPAL